MNPLAQLLPLILLSQLMPGMGGKKTLKHSTGRSVAKDVMGGLTIAGGLTSTVAAPIILAVERPAPLAASGSTADEIAAWCNKTDTAYFAASLTSSIGAGVGLVAAGTGIILAQA